MSRFSSERAGRLGVLSQATAAEKEGRARGQGRREGDGRVSDQIRMGGSKRSEGLGKLDLISEILKWKLIHSAHFVDLI